MFEASTTALMAATARMKSRRSRVMGSHPARRLVRTGALGAVRCPLRARGPSGRGGLLLLDLALQGARTGGQLVDLRLGEEGVEPAAVFDRAQGVRRDAQTHRALQRVRLKRDVAEVRQELPLGLAVRVTDQMAAQHGLAVQFATAGHGFILSSKESVPKSAGLRRSQIPRRPDTVKPLRGGARL